MTALAEVRSERLLLRPWRDADREPCAEMNADPRVVEHLPSALTREQSDALLVRLRAHFDEHGYGLWAVEVPGVASFIGFIGLAVVTFDAPFTPCVEIGWRLAFPFWGKGYATEGARASLAYGFESLGLSEIVSFTTPANVRSWKVMEKLGMKRDPAEDFDHPRIPEGHRLRRHVLYRLPSAEWR